MRIQSGQIIAGYPAMTIRKLMLRGRAYGPGTAGNCLELIADVLDIDLDTARQVFETLCSEGYIEPMPADNLFFHEDQCQWFTTMQGNALANATARKPVTRQTADKQIEQLLARVEQINSGDYAYRVKQLILFGSYLSDAPTLGDVDISIVLEDRYQNAEAREAGHKARITLAMEAGRQFRDIMERFMWPEQEVILLLKNRSPVLSLHGEWREHVLERDIPSRILFDADVPASADNGPSQKQAHT